MAGLYGRPIHDWKRPPGSRGEARLHPQWAVEEEGHIYLGGLPRVGHHRGMHFDAGLTNGERLAAHDHVKLDSVRDRCPDSVGPTEDLLQV